jgi:hypothetical protein
LHGSDSADRDGGDLKAVPAFAGILLHGSGIETAGDLLGGGDGEVLAGAFSEVAALELVLEELAFGLGALENGVGLAEHVGKGFIGEIVKTGCGRKIGSLGRG